MIEIEERINLGYIYINKDGNPFTKKYKVCGSKCKHIKENQDYQNNSNEVQDVMLKRILCHKSTIDRDALVGIRENDEL